MPVAAAVGTVSFLPPCMLSLVPGYLSYITGLAGGSLGTTSIATSAVAAAPVRAVESPSAAPPHVFPRATAWRNEDASRFNVIIAGSCRYTGFHHSHVQTRPRFRWISSAAAGASSGDTSGSRRSTSARAAPGSTFPASASVHSETVWAPWR